MKMHICAMTLDEAEVIMKALEKTIRRHYNLYGAHRRMSYPARANEGMRAVIEVDEIDSTIWADIRDEAMYEAFRRLHKGIGTHFVRILDTWEFATAESM